MELPQTFINVKNAAFACPHCGYEAQQHLYTCTARKEFATVSLQNPLTDKKNAIKNSLMGEVKCTECEVCGFIALWINHKMIFPSFPKNTSKPNDDMPEEIKEIYIEAAKVSSHSLRSAAALLRLCLEKLLDFLKIPGNDLNKKIANSNFPEKILKACDSVRVYGNEAVHPGQIILDDNPEVVTALFKLINYVVEMQITVPRKAEEVFDSLPESKKNQISKRIKDRD